MVKKILPNRISKTVAPDAVAKIRQAVQLIHEALGENTPILEEDYKALRKISDKLKQESDDVYAVAQEHLELVEAPLSITELSKDKSYYEFCDKVAAMLKPALIKMEREQNIAGSEYHNGCSMFEAHVAVKIGHGDTQAQNAQIQLNQINRKKGGGSVSAPKKGA
jgi:uncharacterized protein with gpF-like domain